MKAREEAEYKIYRLKTTIEYYRAILDADDITVLTSIDAIRARTMMIIPREKIRTSSNYDIVIGNNNSVGIVYANMIVMHYPWGITETIIWERNSIPKYHPYGVIINLDDNNVPYMKHSHEQDLRKKFNVHNYGNLLMVDLMWGINYMYSSNQIAMIFKSSIVIVDKNGKNQLRYRITRPPNVFATLSDRKTLCYMRDGFMEFLNPTMPIKFDIPFGKVVPGPGKSFMVIRGNVITFYRGYSVIDMWKLPYDVLDCFWKYQQKRFFIKHEHIDIYSQDKKYIGRHAYDNFPRKTKISANSFKKYEKYDIEHMTEMPFGMVVLCYDEKYFVNITDYNGHLLGWCPVSFPSKTCVLNDRKTLLRYNTIADGTKVKIELVKIEFI